MFSEKKQITKKDVCYDDVIQGKPHKTNFYMYGGDTLQISKSSYTGEGAMGCTKETARALALPPLVSIYIKA